MRVLTLITAVIAYLHCVCLPSSCNAAAVTFSVTQPASSLTLSGDVVIGGVGSFTMLQQSAGSLTTSYTGTITVDVDDLLNPTTITFLSADLVAAVSGNYAPADGGGGDVPAPGNYGISVPGFMGAGKIRDLTLNLTGAATTITGDSFSVTGQIFTATGGSIDVRSQALNPPDGGSGALTDSGVNSSGNNGSYSVVGNLATLTIPSQFAINFAVPGTPPVNGTANLAGSFMATTVVPEPTGMAVTFLSGLGSLLVWRRRRIH